MYAMDTLAVMTQSTAAQTNTKVGSDTKDSQQAGASEEGASFQDLLQQKAEHPNEKPAASQNEESNASPVPTQEAEVIPLQQELTAAMALQSLGMLPVAPQSGVNAAPVETALPLAEAAAVPIQVEVDANPNAKLPQAAPMPQTPLQAETPQTQPSSQPQPHSPAPAPEQAQNAAMAAATAPAPAQQAATAPSQTFDSAKTDANGLGEPHSKGDTKQVTTQQTTQESPAQPLFRELEGTPVKVGEAPIADATAPDFEQQLKAQIHSSFEKGMEKVEIKLTPENLGSLTVELTRSQDGSLQVVLHTTTEQAAKLLGEHAAGLGSLLRSSVQTPVQVEVQQQQSQQQDGQERHGQPQQHQQDQQQQRQHQAHQSQDFLQQLRLGLVPLDSEVS